MRKLEEKLERARTDAEILEALSRLIYEARQKAGEPKDCPPSQIPSPAGLEEWLPECPPEGHEDLVKFLNQLGPGDSWEARWVKINPVRSGGTRIWNLTTGESATLTPKDPDRPHPPGPVQAMAWDLNRPESGIQFGTLSDLHAAWLETCGKHPGASLVRAYQGRAKSADMETRQDRIFPEILSKMRRAPGQTRQQRRLFGNLEVVPRRGEQQVFPFSLEGSGRSLILELFERCGGVSTSPGRGGPASVSLRTWAEGVLSVRREDRDGSPRAFEYRLISGPWDKICPEGSQCKALRKQAGRHVCLVCGRQSEVGMRPLARRLWPKGVLRKSHYDQLIQAAEALDRLWISLRTPDSMQPLETRLVLLSQVQRPEKGRYGHPGRARFVVDLPVGETGPIISPNLHMWGKSAAAFRFLLSAPFYWWKPGRTRAPKGGTWLQLRNPKRYPRLTDKLKIELFHPLSSWRRRRSMLAHAETLLKKLEAAGETQIVDDHLLPPKSWFDQKNF